LGMPARKIIFVNRFFYPDHSATSQILTDLAMDLSQRGVEVFVVASRLSYDDPLAQLPSEEMVGGVRVRRVWSTRFGRGRLASRALDYLTFYIGAAVVLWRLTTRQCLVVAKTDPPLISLLIAPIAKIKGAILINWLQDVFPEIANVLGVKLARGGLLKTLRWARNMTLNTANANVVIGERMAAKVRAEGVDAGRVHVIPNWADGSLIRPVPRSRNSLRRKWGLQEKFVVGYSGNLGRAHEFETILDSAELLRNRENLVFLFIGAGAQREPLKLEAAARGLKNIIFQPYQPREILSESLGVADVHLVSLNPALEGLVVPSKFYGIAAAGRPTIFVGDPDGEIPRILQREQCGYAVRTSDGARLAEVLQMLESDTQLCDRLGQNARNVLETRYDRSLAVDAWDALLKFLVQPTSMAAAAEEGQIR
jgi:colanic acid biosynthesis glycosyl transferase WcaI